MGRREPQQDSMLVPAIRGPSHLSYDRLNAEFDEATFDLKVEKLCEGFFEQEEKRGRPSIAPGMYFRMLLLGYFEGIESERGIKWRCTDSLSLRRFLRVGELVERPNAHLYETGGMRRFRLRGRSNANKRLLIHAAAANLGLVMRKAHGFGTREASRRRQSPFCVHLLHHRSTI